MVDLFPIILGNVRSDLLGDEVTGQQQVGSRTDALPFETLDLHKFSMAIVDHGLHSFDGYRESIVLYFCVLKYGLQIIIVSTVSFIRA